jgi:hypothetical protein
MNEVRDRARLVDASAFDGRGVTATVPRTEIEAVLSSPDGPPELVLGVERRAGDEVEGHTLRIEWDPKELEELLRTTSGDQVTLVLDSAELERAIDADVEAHGLREAAAIFAVAVTTAAAATAGAAHATPTQPFLHDGGGATGTPIVMVSDAGTGGYGTTTHQAPPLVSDAGLSGQASGAQMAANQAAQGPEIVSDAASSGVAETPQLVSDAGLSGQASGAQMAASQATQGPEIVSDAASSGVAETPQIVSDAASSGPVGMTPEQIVQAAGVPPQMVSDAASSGPVAQAPEASGGGFSISAPDPTTTGIIVGAVALTIVAAAFTVRGRRPQAGHFA